MLDWLVNVARKSNLLNRSENSNYLNFLIEIFNAIVQSDGCLEVVYPLLSANQDKLNDNLIQVLQELVTVAFEQVESELKQKLADIVFKFSSLIQYFPLPIWANNVEIAISGYQVILKFNTRGAYPYNWASTQSNLANAYFERIKGERAENLETAIAAHQEVLEVHTFEAYPYLYLHQIPFAALPLVPASLVEESSVGREIGGEEKLSDRFEIRHVPSCQILQFCQERLDTTDNILEAQIGTVEDTDGTLPGASLEGEKIARLFNIPDERRLRGHTQATVNNYRQLAKRVNILHSSHHASSRLDKPLESILVLGDGKITLGELLTPSWRLRNLKDVFLSCCETHLGKIEIADDIFTLATGFLCAGAKSVVSTLWAVEDIPTVLFCIFYYQLRYKGYSRSQAIQKAQNQLRTITKEELNSYLQQEARQAEEEYQQAKKKLKQIAKDTPEYQELAVEKENFNQIAKDFRNLWKKAEQYCKQELPFEHPFYWAGFISQGIR
jgi:CHAT domain-containing protein